MIVFLYTNKNIIRGYFRYKYHVWNKIKIKNNTILYQLLNILINISENISEVLHLNVAHVLLKNVFLETLINSIPRYPKKVRMEKYFLG